MQSGGIISLTLKSLPTSGNATPLAQLTWRRLAQVPTRVTLDGRRLPPRKHAYANGLAGSTALKTSGTEDVDGELSSVNSTRDTIMKLQQSHWQQRSRSPARSRLHKAAPARPAEALQREGLRPAAPRPARRRMEPRREALLGRRPPVRLTPRARQVTRSVPMLRQADQR